MGKLSKTIGAPIGNVVEPELMAIAATEEVRTSTPLPTTDLEPEKVPPGDGLEPYKPGKTPPYESPEPESSENEDEESGSEDEEVEDKNIPGPAPPAPWSKVVQSGPITPADVPEPEFLKEFRDKNLPRVQSKTAAQEPEKMKDSDEPIKATPKKLRDREPKDLDKSTPRKIRELEPKGSEKKSDGKDPQALFFKQQEIIDKMTQDRSLSDTDTRTITLTLHTQVATLTGSINNVVSSVDKLQSKIRSMHGHSIGLEDATNRGMAKLDELMTNAWRSQGRNRASIDENRALIKEVQSNIVALTAAVGTGAKAPSGIPTQDPNWMHPQPGPTGGAMLPPIHPINFNVAPAGAPGNGFAAYGYQGRDPQQIYQSPPECAFCLGGHPPEKCRAVPKWHLRRGLMLERKACYLCLKTGTSPDGSPHEDCPAKVLCTLCHVLYPNTADIHRRQHHVSLCERIKPMPAETKEASAPPPKKAKPTIKKESSSKSSSQKKRH